MDILLKNVHLIAEPDNNTIIQTNIVIEDKIISEISPTAQISAPEYVIEGKAHVVLPPPINSHTHLPMTLLRGYSDNKELMSWLQEDIWPQEGKFDRKWMTIGTKLDCLDMIKSGTGVAADFYFH